MNIYLGNAASPISSLSSSRVGPAHECIGAVYKILSEMLGRGEKPESSLMDKISADIESPELINLVRRISDESSYHLSPTEDGVIFALDRVTNEPFAVIKPSRKRANYETFAYLLAKKLGLNNHILPSAFCAIKNPQALSTESIQNGDWMEELFNGDFKQLNIPTLNDDAEASASDEESDAGSSSFSTDESFSEDSYSVTSESDSEEAVFSFHRARSSDSASVIFGSESESDDESVSDASSDRGSTHTSSTSSSEGNYFAVGVIEPFVNKTIDGIDDHNIGEYAKMVTLCLALGLRDGKDDGYIDFKLIDVEEIMPTYLHPIVGQEDEHIAATHLPLLDNPFSDKKLPSKAIKELRDIVSSWDMEELNEFLIEYPIKFPDAAAETEKRKRETPELFDEGGCEYKYIPERVMLAAQSGSCQFKGLPKKDPLVESPKLLDTQQIDTFFSRIIAIKEFIEKNDKFSLRDLVFHVDPMYKNAMDQISELVKMGIAQGNLNARSYERTSPFDTAGRMSPFHVREKTSSPVKHVEAT